MSKFDKTAQAYWGVIKAHPDMSADKIIKMYSKSGSRSKLNLGMRRGNAQRLIKQLKQANQFRIANANSDMLTNKDQYGRVLRDSRGKPRPPETQERMARGLYNTAKRYAKGETQKKGEEFIIIDGEKHASIDDARRRTHEGRPPEDHTVFYPEDVL